MANEELEYQKSIDKIANEINAISRNINANKKAIKNERDRLFETEQGLSKLKKTIKSTENSIVETQEEYAQLGVKLAEATVVKEKNQKALSNLVESRYKNADQDYVKTILNQENPYAVGRLSNYHEYFSDAFQAKIAQAKTQLIEVEELTQAHEAKLKELNAKKVKQQQEQKQLEQNKVKRENSINKLNEIAKQKEQLKKIEEQNSSPSRPTRTLVKGGFVKQKGRLNYPVNGTHSRKFGSRLAESGMLSEGLFIKTNGNASVKSIFRGRVIFAEFLKGYGLLLIIDHGDNHISLYGHNDVLYKKVGDIVETNEVVSQSGVTGGLRSAGLYFEIRKNATPVNPATWCQ